MNKELYINDYLIELDEKDSPVELNFAVNNLAELKDRQAYSTNIFKVPATQNNLIRLGHPESDNLIGTTPYRKNKARIVQNGVELFSDGVAIIQSAGEKIAIQVLSGIVGIFEAIDGKYLSDLNLEEFNHFYNASNVVLQEKSSGWIYPIIDYGDMSDTVRAVDIRQLRPAIFLHSIIKKIFDQAGYSYSGAIFSNSNYLRELLPFSNDKFVHSQQYIDLPGVSSVVAGKTVGQNYSQTENTDPGTLGTLITFVASSDPGLRWTGSEYYAGVPCKVAVNVRIVMDIGMIKNGPTPTAIIKLDRRTILNGSTYYEQVAEYRAEYPGNSGTVRHDFQLGGELIIEPGEGFRIEARAFMQGTGTPSVIAATVLTSSAMTATEDREEVIFGQMVQASAIVPPITQKDLLKDFMQRKGLTMVPVPGTKSLRFFSMDDVYNNKSVAKNWSKKIIGKRELSYSLPGYGVNNNGKFKDDAAVDSAIGQGTLVLDNQTLTPIVESFVSPFAASQTTRSLSGYELIEILKIPDPSKSKEFSVKTEPRILINNLVSNSGILMRNGNAGLIVGFNRSIPYFTKTGQYSLDYDYIFKNFYVGAKKMLNRPVVVDVDAIVSEIDICNIDWAIPIFDEKTSEYYYLNEISGYIQGRTCRLSLIKL